MDQPSGVRRIQGPGDLTDDVDSALGGQRAMLGQDRREICAVNQTHVQEQPAFDLAEGVDGDHVSLPQSGGKLGLTTEPRTVTLVLDQEWSKHLEGDHPPVTLVVGLVDLAHPPATEQPLDPVGTKPFPGLHVIPSQSGVHNALAVSRRA